MIKKAPAAKKAAVKAPARKAAAKPAEQPVAEAVAKPEAAATPAATPAAKKAATTKAATTKAAAKPRAKTAKAAAPAAEAPREKVRKAKLVRDSFTMPETEYAVLGQVKKACLKAGIDIKKSELLRVGVALISQLDMATLQKVLASLPELKTGRPSKE